jgi:hypothetical protein
VLLGGAPEHPSDPDSPVRAKRAPVESKSVGLGALLWPALLLAGNFDISILQIKLRSSNSLVDGNRKKLDSCNLDARKIHPDF